MAIEIIHRGNAPEEKEYKATCWTCTTVIKFKRADATYHSDQRDGAYLSITCPVCLRSLTVSA